MTESPSRVGDPVSAGYHPALIRWGQGGVCIITNTGGSMRWDFPAFRTVVLRLPCAPYDAVHIVFDPLKVERMKTELSVSDHVVPTSTLIRFYDLDYHAVGQPLFSG